jgi:Sulfatase-modifying factor enzyme 1
VLRGGSWNNNATNARASNRNRNEPENRNNNIGFRCAGMWALSIWKGKPEPNGFRSIRAC